MRWLRGDVQIVWRVTARSGGHLAVARRTLRVILILALPLELLDSLQVIHDMNKGE